MVSPIAPSNPYLPDPDPTTEKTLETIKSLGFDPKKDSIFMASLSLLLNEALKDSFWKDNYLIPIQKIFGSIQEIESRHRFEILSGIEDPEILNILLNPDLETIVLNFAQTSFKGQNVIEFLTFLTTFTKKPRSDLLESDLYKKIILRFNNDASLINSIIYNTQRFLGNYSSLFIDQLFSEILIKWSNLDVLSLTEYMNVHKIKHSAIETLLLSQKDLFKKSKLDNFRFFYDAIEGNHSEDSLKNFFLWGQLVPENISNLSFFYEKVKDIPFDSKILNFKEFIKDEKFINSILAKPSAFFKIDNLKQDSTLPLPIKEYLANKIIKIFPKSSLEGFYSKVFPDIPVDDLIVSLSLNYFDFPFIDTPPEIQSIITEIPLKNGKVLTRESFETDPLFNYGKEKSGVFSHLWIMIHRNPALFEVDYTSFLENLSREDWFEPYRNVSKSARMHASLFGFLAFLNGDINKESLLVLQTVLQGFNEIGKDLIVKTLTTEALPDYLHATGFPPFTPNTAEYMVTYRKSEEDLMSIKKEIIRNFDTKSSLERTFIEYKLSTILLEVPQVEGTIINSMLLNSKIGSRNDEYAVLGPPIFITTLLHITSAVSTADPEQYRYSFGYSKSDGTPYYEGYRAISIPSPCFELPNVHEFKSSKRPGLAMLFHDVNYHIAIEANNPHRILISIIANQFSKTRSHHPKIKKDDLDRSLRNFCIRFAMVLADREAIYYRSPIPVAEAFWKFIFRSVNDLSALTEENRIAKFTWEKTIAIPVIVDTLIKEGCTDLLEVEMQNNFLDAVKEYACDKPLSSV
jgi:hypothetical protein